MSSSALERLLGRPAVTYPIDNLAGRRILVTGHRGAIGSELVPLLRAAGADVLGVDLPAFDVTTRGLMTRIKKLRPDIIYHLAADKHAPAGEYHPYATQRVNIEGTERMLMAISTNRNARLILASTCKAIVPETVYGASKLVAERMTLNEAGIVGRLYNVWPTHGNVLELWEHQRGQSNCLMVTDCYRYAISINEATSFLASLATAPRATRYSPFPGDALYMPDVAQRWLEIFHADDPNPPRIIHTDRRRGDRQREPLYGPHETVRADEHGRLIVTSEHDHAEAPALIQAATG